MADSEVEVAPSVVEEVGEGIKASGAAESPQLGESDATADEIVPAAANHKRKLDDLEPSHHADGAPDKKQEFSTEIPSLGAAEPGSGDGEVTGSALVEDSDEVKAGHAENGDQKLEVSEAAEVETDDQVEQQQDGTDGLVPAETENELRGSEIQTHENGNMPSEKNAESIASPPVDVDIVSCKIEVPNNKIKEKLKYMKEGDKAVVMVCDADRWKPWDFC
ncbi:uncharacterized protein LOC121985420 isoform X3 [Zingiber officinale]|uniref:uncharacterized protein LOC121985420 isoform X3 n=1 Tax=Zingiber officinale TaxID=94328 RepID=UPI001C4CBF80|nr:uncharacterized protein LOC121985420 isoform X3 [Zingiber officinale]